MRNTVERARSRGVCQVLVLLAALLTPAPAAQADTFLLKKGGRVDGELEREYRDEFRAEWFHVGTPFGAVHVQKKHVKRHLKSERTSGVLRLDEMRVVHLNGDVRRSSDQGTTWLRLRMPGDDASDTGAKGPWPEIHPGDLVRTGSGSDLELDVGFGFVRVGAESEAGFATTETATVTLRSGRAGAKVDRDPNRKDEFRVETPQAVLGVRGTLFLVDVSDQTYVAVGHGSVAVADDVLGPEDAVTVTATGRHRSSVTSDDWQFLRTVDTGLRFPRHEWVALPGAKFVMGGPDERGSTNSANSLSSMPTVEVEVGPILVARRETTRSDVAAFREWVERYGLVAPWPPEAVPPKKMKKEVNPEAGRTSERVIEEPARDYWIVARAYALWVGGNLPTEAQWEYAARGGTSTSYWWGNDIGGVLTREWLLFNSGDRTIGMDTVIDGEEARRRWLKELDCRPRKPGTAQANPFGLFDVLGNAREWTLDAPGPMKGYPTDGSARPGPADGPHVVRGSMWEATGYFRVSVRTADDTAAGWRVVKSLE